MIFDNSVQSGQMITSTVWNRAFGFNGTAMSLYSLVGGQQSGAQQYSATSWPRGIQNPVSTTPVQFSFISTTFPSNYREGDLLGWTPGFTAFDNNGGPIRDSAIIQRDGFYAIQIEVGVTDSANRFGNSANADGTGIVPNISLLIRMVVADENQANSKEFHRITNVIDAAAGSTPQFVQPYFSAFANYILPLSAQTQIILYAVPSVESIRSPRIVHACLKTHLLKAL